MPEGATEASSGDEVARAAGRGGLAIAGAKIYFMAVGLVQQIALKHILGLQTYGALGRVQGLASIIYNPIIATDVQGVSRAVSGASDEAKPATQRRVLGIHSALILPFALGFFVAAPAIADLIGAPHLALGLRIVAGVMLFYGLYTPLVGVINGHKRFTVQAGLDVLAATIRTVGLLGGAWYFTQRGLGLEGALGGFVVSAGMMAMVALPLAGIGRRGPGAPSFREHLSFIAPLFGGQLALNFLFQSDLQLLGRFAAEAAVAAGSPAEAADTLAGAYRNAQLFCFLPYQLLLSVTFVLFPLLATAYRDDDKQAVTLYVRTGVRLALILAGAIVSVSAAIPGALLNLVFGADSAALAGRPMFVLALGQGAFAVFGILATVLTSIKRERVSAALTTVALALVVVLCFVLVRGRAFGADLLLRTAVASGSGILVATLLAAHQVKRAAGAVVHPLTVVRVLLGLGVAIGVGRLLPAPGKLMTLVYAPLLAGCFVVVLVITREIGRDDLKMIQRVVGRRS